MSTLRDQYMDLLRAVRAARLAALDIAFDRAAKDDDAGALGTVRAERRSLLDFPASVPPDADRAALVALWPATLAPLPRWFVDPEEAARLDPPGKPVVIDCADPPPAPGEEATLDPSLEAAIVAKRFERAAADDIARGAALERQTSVQAEVARKLAAESAKTGGA